MKNTRHGEGYMEYANGNTIQVKVRVMYVQNSIYIQVHVCV